MSLVVKLAAGERIFINGAVLTNGDRRSQLLVETAAQVLRERDILSSQEPLTPVRTAYFAAQNIALGLRLDLAPSAPFQAQIARLRGAFVKPEHLALLDEAEAQIASGNVYRALAALRDLVMYEAALLGITAPERFRRGASPAAEEPMPRVQRVTGALLQ
ncbi:flagellar biosynthesis repressor FlbT [Paracraurococcus ruber]|uniref:Flagellar biosynthesis repressor FlbT n=1 Tax=Paracraurococcus ruber TaxID=77675 RepID=A0ABS1CQK6_9PROT|nr:flagellar biosynthesis repressor FlbT [Paracraurococcus ruber]MBK1656630.1 flagellar biosynthesis repressor FlbT [Paracraurococcus ruber]TDG33746.1 flagellar biosynthesis repressor FlbT [Paracraurococcus ruber]